MAVEVSEQERYRVIREVLHDQPFATVKDLLDVLDVSPATIRRDIAKLHDAGVIRKVFGGIALPESASMPRMHSRPFSENQVINVEAKRAIAMVAEKLCKDGDSLVINGGTTCFIFAQMLSRRSLKIFTNSMPLASSLWETGFCHLTLAGGELYREPGIVYSSTLPDPDFFASKFFLGAQSITSDGIIESHPLMESVITRLAAKAADIVVLADSSKFDIRARFSVMPLARINTLITDDRISQTHVDMLESEGIDVIIANVPKQDGP
jgi:DeoR family transcriptional regulator, ulaG and ulaABCDEF operon transcriptional repressor